MYTFGNKTRMWVPPHEVESSALDQIRAVEALPEVQGIAVMPDVHAGVGATVGSVIATKDAVMPGAVGVDIGCGMAAMRLVGVRLDDLGDLAHLRRAIEDRVPVGFNAHKTALDHPAAAPLFAVAKHLTPGVHDALDRARLQLGTLGGGNHFIEVCLDELGQVWVMLHSGSRNIGKRIADVFIAKAGGPLGLLRAGTPEYEAYLGNLLWAQKYALVNRSAMMRLVLNAVASCVGRVQATGLVECHHNYAAPGGGGLIITRKGAISARVGEPGIIPGSMGQRSYIVKGLGNPDSYHSASHGAGRRMSRSAAKRAFTTHDAGILLDGVECRKDEGIVDELPCAYKDIDVVMEQQKDLVAIEHELRAVLCVKG